MTNNDGAGWQRPELLVETQWLAERLGDPAIRILDCDPPEVAHLRGHIPGAVLLPVHPYVRDQQTGAGVAPPEQAEEIFRACGIDEHTLVVCYDSQGSLLAARVWWVLWFYGHERVAVLDGGIAAWQAEGRPLERQRTQPPPGSWRATAHPERIASCDTLLPRLGAPELVPLDVRSWEEWAGVQPVPPDLRQGHIPGAVRIEWREMVDWERQGRLRQPDELRALLESNGVTPDKQVVPY